MSKRVWMWLLGLSLLGLVMCGGFVLLGVWVAGFSDQGDLAFGDALAIVKVEGTIVPGDAPPPDLFGTQTGLAFSQTVIDHLKKADENDNVKVVILYVDSPGGSVYASDEIARQVMAMSKPVVVNMASLAASGGYYVSAPAQEIWAAPSTLTCSIGVISQFINVEEFAEQYGITAVTIKSGQFKDMGNPFREFTQGDREVWQAIIDEAYNDFVQIVAEGRGMDEAEVRRVADGRICTGQQALEAGLVDELGYLPDVIDRAAELANIDGEPRIIRYGQSVSLFSSVGNALHQPSPVDELRQLLNYHPGSPLMYLYTP